MFGNKPPAKDQQSSQPTKDQQATTAQKGQPAHPPDQTKTVADPKAKPQAQPQPQPHPQQPPQPAQPQQPQQQVVDPTASQSWTTPHTAGQPPVAPASQGEVEPAVAIPPVALGAFPNTTPAVVMPNPPDIVPSTVVNTDVLRRDEEEKIRAVQGEQGEQGTTNPKP